MASTSTPDAAPPAAADASAPLPPVEQLNYGIREGEVNEMEQKWGDWADDVEENKRLVIDEVEHQAPLTPFAATPGRTFRPRRRNVVSQALVARAPVFYGWVVGGLAALAALLVSPVQVYCVGVVLDAMQFDLALSRMRISAIYAASLLSAAPFLFKEGGRGRLAAGARRALRRPLLRRLRAAHDGAGPTALLAVWTLMQVVGPGVLYPPPSRRSSSGGAAAARWSAPRCSRSARCSACSSSPPSSRRRVLARRRRVVRVGGVARRLRLDRAAFLVPALLLSLLLLEGGAVDHGCPSTAASADATGCSRARPSPPPPPAAPERGGDDGDDDGIEMHGAETARAPEAPSPPPTPPPTAMPPPTATAST